MPIVATLDPLTIWGHVARGGAHARLRPTRGMLVVQGPFAYVSPSYYPSKRTDGKVVPTWNYEAVHAQGALRWFDEPRALLELLDRLTGRFEAARPHPWSVSDAPRDYVDRLLAGIVGVEMSVTRLEGARKLSQNRTADDRAGVIAGLSGSDDPMERALAARMRP